MFGDADKLPPDARANYDRWRALGEVRAWDDGAIAERVQDGDVALVIDAVFGTGLTRSAAPIVAKTYGAMTQRCYVRNRPCVAVDVPSGLCSDSGRDLGRALPANLTVTFHTPKPGHVLDQGPLLCGELRLKDIGL